MFRFENRGREIGVTLHPPARPDLRLPLRPAAQRRSCCARPPSTAATGGNLLADVLAAERRAGTRVVLTGEHWTAFVPAAARWPVEVHLAPHRDVPDFAALDDAERDELAHVYLDLLRRADRYFDGVERPAVHRRRGTRPPSASCRELGRLHLQLFSVMRAPGRLKYLAGSESGHGRLDQRRLAGGHRRPAARGGA